MARPNINFAALSDALLVGSYPQTPEDVLHLKGLGITAVLNVQSDADLAMRAIRWDLFEKFYAAQGILALRSPITDFDPDDLFEKLDFAMTTLDGLLRAGRKVYLHCSAGINRSPTVAVAWFTRHGGMTLEAALAHVRARREPAVIYADVLDLWERLSVSGDP